MKELEDRAWLEQKYIKENMTMEQIGALLGKTKHPIYRALKKHGLQARVHSSKHQELNDKEWLRNEYLVKNKSIKQIAIDINATVGNVHSALTHIGIKTRTPKEAYHTKYDTGRFGENASNWKGGRKLTANGHVYIYYPNHPYATKEGYIMEHRMVMEEYLGKIFSPEYVIHHIDGDKVNNNILNLMLLPDRGIHAQIHFEACQEIAWLKKYGVDHEPYIYRCLPADYTNLQNPFDL